jgi:large subunit ribosomal protein L20
MARVKGGPKTHLRHKKILKQAAGFNQGRRRLFRRAHEAVVKARVYAYRDRRNRKRDMRRLWIQRINAAARAHGQSYGRFMHALGVAGVALDRKWLADIAVRDPAGFDAIAEVARGASS